MAAKAGGYRGGEEHAHATREIGAHATRQYEGMREEGYEDCPFPAEQEGAGIASQVRVHERGWATIHNGSLRITDVLTSVHGGAIQLASQKCCPPLMMKKGYAGDCETSESHTPPGMVNGTRGACSGPNQVHRVRHNIQTRGSALT